MIRRKIGAKSEQLVKFRRGKRTPMPLSTMFFYTQQGFVNRELLAGLNLHISALSLLTPGLFSFLACLQVSSEDYKLGSV